MARTQDLTVGSTKMLLLYFAFPTLISNLFQQFYNLADTAIAGHILGDNALVAIGAGSSIYSLVLTFAFGLNGGFGIIIAQCFGARDEKRLKNTVAHSLALNVLISVAVCIASLFAAKPVLRLMNTPEAHLEEAYGYIIIILTMIIVPMLYNLEATVLRSLGDSKTPLYFLILASILNIVLDYVFIKYLNMGVRGAAAATIAAQLVAVLLCLAVIIKSFKIIRLSKESFIPSRALLGKMLSTGMAMAMMNSIFSVGSIIMQGAINALGENIIAAHLASRKAAEMFMQPLVTLSTACSTFVGQNYGAAKYKRINEAIKYSIIYAFAWSVITFFVLFFAGGEITRLITGTASNEVIESTQMYLKINAPFYFVLGILFILRFSIQSIDRRIPPLISSTMELATKICAAFVFIPKWEYFGACIAEPVSWCLGAVFLIFAFKKALNSINKK